MRKQCRVCLEDKYISEFKTYRVRGKLGYRNVCTVCLRKQQKLYRSNNKDKIRESQNICVENNREHVAKKKKEWAEKNRDRVLKASRKYRKNNKIACNLRTRISELTKGKVKAGSAVKDLGCTLDEFKKHLQNKFYVNSDTGEMMTWDNYGKWHVDHIKPLSLFDLSDPVQFNEACHYTNLQPLWAEENLSKGAKYEGV